MAFDNFTAPVRSAAELATIVGTPSSVALKKELKTLDQHMRRFIAHSPFIVISTHSADGRCDAYPRGDAPGFVHVVDDQTLLIPDRPGNRRADSFRNILETGRIGLLFLVPGVGETLRVNGRAAIIRDEPWLATLEAQGKRPLLALVADAEHNLAVCYQKGFGVEKDPHEAVEWCRKAADQGLARAQGNLGNCYFLGTGVDKDPREAVKWYRKAADQGFAKVEYNLGTCYWNGTGVNEDQRQAVEWFRKAAAHGDVDAKKALNEK